jgi:hypothetical protein
MKTLPLTKDASGNRATVDCADGEVSAYRHCAFCEHCKGVRVGPRVYSSPQDQVLKDVKRGAAADEALMNAALQFNQLIRDGVAIECADQDNQGFKPRYRL